MILGAEIGLFVMGLYSLFTRKLTLSKTKVVRGTPAQLIGALGLLPIPAAVLIGISLGAVAGAQGGSLEQIQGLIAGVEVGVVLLTIVLIYVLGLQFAKHPDEDAAA